MLRPVELPLWLVVLILGFASVTFASHFLFPSVRWFFRRRMERAVDELNKRLQRPVEPFKLLERHDRILRLLYDPHVMQAVAEHARAAGVPRNVAFQRAMRYAREIVPGFSASIYFGFSVRLARWLSRFLYNVRVTAVDEAALRDADRDATVVFVMNHRSNMDYVLVTWLVSARMTLSYAVGEWARVWPLSFLIRSMGAYFIRRKNTSPLYRRVLERYVRMSTSEGVTQAIFPEGGLSLDGRTGPPKLGLLSYLLAEGREGTRDVIFVPVGLGYDRVIEDRVLSEAADTGVRRFKVRLSLIMLYVARMMLRRAFGRWRGFGGACVSFGRPIKLSALLDEAPLLGTEALAARLMSEVGKVLPVLPVPLVAQALMSTKGPMARADLEAEVGRILEVLRASGVVLSIPDAPLEALVRDGLDALRARGTVRDEGARVSIVPERRQLLAYQAASVAQILFADAANCSVGAAEGT